MNLPLEIVYNILSYSDDLDVKREFGFIKKIKNIKNKEKIKFIYRNRYIGPSSNSLKETNVTSELNNLQKLQEREDIENINLNDFVSIKIMPDQNKYVHVLVTFYILKSFDTIETNKIYDHYQTMSWVVINFNYKY